MSFRLALVWIVLALLPLRGWAVMAMGIPDAAPQAALQVQQTQPHHAIDSNVERSSTSVSAMPPCHDASTADSVGSPTGHACTLCDLCHSAVTVPRAPLTVGAPLPPTLPRPGMERDTGRNAVGGLDRPPRPPRA